MKYKKQLSLIMLLTIIVSFFEGMYLPPNEARAASVTENVDFSFITPDSELRYVGGGVYSANKTLKTNTISLDAGAGRKIEELAWYIGSQKIQAVSGASGSQKWTGTLTLSGEARTVVSRDNSGGAGGWYSWDRYGLDSKGNGRVWYGGATSVHQNTGCSSGPPDTAKNNVPMWPGCDSEDLELPVFRNKSYLLESDASVQIPAYVVSTTDLKVENVVPDLTADILMPALGITGRTDSSTRYRSFKVVSPNEVNIVYYQNFNNNRYHKDWANPWAQMIVYFAKFKADFVSKTYWYPATLKVTYADVDSGNGTAYVRHVTRDGQSLSSVFPDRIDTLIKDQPYNPKAPIAAGYNYAGHVKTTTGTPPTNFSNPTGGEYSISKYDGSFKTLYLYYVYDIVSAGEIHVRHMVRNGPAGTYVKDNESVTAVPSLPKSHTLSADTSKGTVKGHSISYTSYSNTVTSGSSVTSNLTSSQNKAYVSFFYEKPVSFTGDFDIIPDTINYREQFKFQPKDFQLNGCTYQSHSYKIERDGTFTSPPIVGQNTPNVYSFSNYPWNIGVGVHMVSMKIKTTNCGESDWIGPKPLTVNADPKNRPPEFKVGFVHPNDRKTPLTEVVEGTILDLVYINDPSVPTPTDPDGDNIYFMGFDTAGSSSSFVQSIPSKGFESGDGYRNITMDTLGYHSVSAQMRDEWGLTTTASTMIKVIPKNPIPRLSCPAEVVENRPVDLSVFDPSRSYSPIGRTIDHSRNEWTNRKTSYVNGTTENIIIKVSLHVYDSAGLKSIEAAECNIIVKPDLPPIAQLEVPPLGIRNSPVEIWNASYSPDGDKIVSAEYKYKYDSNNNGFSDDPWQPVLNNSLISFTFNPPKVGKYLFYTKVTEDYGMSGDTSKTAEATLTLNIVNNAPEVSFTMEGNNPQPDLSVPLRYPASKILSTWELFKVNSSSKISYPTAKWSNVSGALVGRLGKQFERLYPFYVEYNRGGHDFYNAWFSPFQDFGFGPNNQNPYRAIKADDPAKSQPVLIQIPGQNEGKPFPLLYSMDQNHWYSYKMMLRTNPSHIYFNYRRYRDWDDSTNIVGQYLYAMNKSKIGRYEHRMGCQDPCYWPYSDHTWLDGSPYDFVLSPEALRDASNKPKYERVSYWSRDAFNARDKTRATSFGTTAFQKLNILGYEVSDKTIYQKIRWECSKYSCPYYYDGWEDSYDYEGVVEIRTYDAFTGQFIASSALQGINLGIGAYSNLNAYAKGDNLLILDYEYVDGKSVETVFEVNRQAKLVKKTRVVRPDSYTKKIGSDTYTCNYTPIHTIQGAEGERYGYEQVQCRTNSGGSGFSDGLYVFKYNPDFSLAWRVKLQGVNPTFAGSVHHVMGDPSDDQIMMVLNPIKKELLVRSYTIVGFGYEEYYDLVHIDTGAKRTWDKATYNWSATFSAFDIHWNGNYILRNSTKAPLTVDGYRTTFESVDSVGSRRNLVKDDSGNVISSWIGGGLYEYNGMWSSTAAEQVSGTYVGDGIFLSYWKTANGSGYSRQYIPWINVGTPTDNAKPYTGIQLGQFVSDVTVDNSTLTFTMNMFKPKIDNELAGFSFRMQNPKNRYAVETDGSTLYLSKYVNGTRTVLQSIAYPFQPNTNYNFKVNMLGERIEVILNGVPYFDETDSQFSSGKIGMFAVKSYVTFNNVSVKEFAENPNLWSNQYAIWDAGKASAEVKYDNIVFKDPENDPLAGTYQWTIEHTVRFINNQGLSALHGKTFNTAQLTFDKVGDYLVKLRAKDDPHPDYRHPSVVFDEYRKASNEFTQIITVHRRPIANFTVSQNADGTIKWTDYSLDPDRYESATKYSTEATGIDYKATRGIMEKRFYYISPSGTYVPEKLVAPQETGQYEIAMAVKDEYGAWSEYHVVTLDVDKIAAPNTPPVPGFMTSHTTTYRGVAITINSTAYDAEDGPRENLPHAYYIRNLTTAGIETLQNNSRTSWTKTFNSLGTFNIRQVVEDSVGATAQFERQVTIVNRKPVANITVPPSANQSNPTKLTVLRPTFQWTYSDADSDVQSQYQIRIYRYGGVLQLDSTERPGNALTWTPGMDLPEKVNMYIQVRVHDGFEWGDWSAAKYFYIETNRPPVPGFSWSPTLIFEGDTITIHHEVDDPDRDNLNVTYEITNPNNVKSTFSYTLTYPYPSSGGPSYRATLPGNYSVLQTVSDGKAPAVTLTKYFTVNPLGITGYVNHTPQWENNRKSYNQIKTKTDDNPWIKSRFLAGEKFMLSADTTDTTGSTTVATQVTVTLIQTGDAVGLTSTDGRNWSGELWKEDYDKLETGPYRFRFRVQYSNGVVKTDDVDITIDQTIHDYYTLIRTK